MHVVFEPLQFGFVRHALVVCTVAGALCGLLGVFVGFAVPRIQLANLTPVLGSGVLPVLAGAAIFVWSWDGFMRMAIMASEVKEPRRTIPFAVVGGIAFAAVVFVVVAGAVLGVLGADGITAEDANATPLLAAQLYTRESLVIMTVCAVLVAWPIQAYEWSGTVSWPKALIVHPLFVLSLLAMFAQSFNPFLYFQF